MISIIENTTSPTVIGTASNLRNSAFKADMAAQSAWLLGRARAEGYQSLNELVQVNRQRFDALGFEWRRSHPFR